MALRHPEAIHRGDFLQDDPNMVAQLIREHDPQGLMIVLFVAAPPCPDFSKIRDDAPGSAGPEGQKFTQYCAFVNKIEEQIPHKRVGHLVENVLMAKGEADHFSSRLDCQAVACDSADLGLINRPRLWWSRINWSKIRSSPWTGHRLKWGKAQKFHRVYDDGPRQDASQLDLGEFKLHHTVENQSARIPCLTTPAPDEAGRAAPRKLRGRMPPEQRSRWMQDNRCFAPWQYADHAMVYGPAGEPTVPSADMKEQFHQLPAQFTKATGVSERSRHRMLANGWHFGTTRFMFMLVLQAVLLLPTASPTPMPRTSPLQLMIQTLHRFEPSIGPGTWTPHPSCIPPATSMWHHWELAQRAQHHLQQEPHLEPGLRQCLDIHQLFGPDLARLRSEILDELEEMVLSRAETTMAWWQELPPHVAQVYYDKEHRQISQIPVFLDLLHLAGMPDLATLATDLQQGFNMLGEIHDGAGWLPRADQRYDFPISMETFREHNKNYTIKKLQSGRVDDAWQVMLTELLQELDKGRMDGPFIAPEWWPVQAISIPGRDAQQLPDGATCFSFCFSVKQSDKTRRCEDFRRSGHNMTIKTGDTPHHHDVQTFAALARAYPDHSELPHVWAQDLNGAYRQFPVRDPCDCLCVLQTPALQDR